MIEPEKPEKPDLPHQVANAEFLAVRISSHRAVADWSEMGAGKTRTFMRVIRRRREPTLVVGPKISESSIRRTGQETGTGFSFCNWEMLRTGRSPYGWWAREPVSAAKAKKNIAEGKFSGTRKRIGSFVWSPEVRFIVFDEGHRAKAPDSRQACLLRAARDQSIPHVIVSATPPADPTELRAIGYSMGLHDWDGWFNWCRRNGCYKLPMGGLQFSKRAEVRQKVIDKIRAEWADRCVRTTLREVYPDNALVVLPELYDVPEADAMRQLTEDAIRHLAAIEGPTDSEGMLAYLRDRQRMEMLKVPVLVELAKNGMEAGRTVHVFVNYTETIHELKRHLPQFPIISGEAPYTKPGYRQEVMDAAQWGKIPGVILNCAAGSESISLQDLSGEHPPESLICVPDSVARFVQLLGRTDRVGGKSIPLARLVLAAGSEEKIYNRLSSKRNDLARLVSAEDLELGT